MSAGDHDYPTGTAPVPAPSGQAPAPSHAERARTLCAMQQQGTLSTVAREPAGYPYGSLVLYALDERGRPLLLLSRLAEHTQNLLADGRGSLLAYEAAHHPDPLALGRVTLLGRLGAVPEAELASVRERYVARHAAGERYLAMRDFAFYRLEVEALRYIGGYGRMSWVVAEEYARAEADPIAPAAPGVLEHMNQDHAAALLGYARAHAGLDDATAAVMTAVDRYGFEMTVTTPAGPRPARLGFSRPIASATEARGELVRMAREAREKLENR